MANTGMGLSQQMRQKQVIAPQMRQSLEVLQLQVQDLCQLAQQELEQNPTLEEVSVMRESIDAARERFLEHSETAGDGDYADTAPVRAETVLGDGEELGGTPAGAMESSDVDFANERDDGDGHEGFEAPREEREVLRDDGDVLDPLDFSVLGQLDDIDYLYQEGGNSEYNPDIEERRQFMFDSLTRGESLQEHLIGQIDYADLNEVEQLIAEQIVGSIDDDGYLRTPLADMVQVIPGATMAQAERVLAVVQEFHPLGVGARDLRECLLIQIRQSALKGTLSERLVESYLKWVETRQLGKIAKALGVSRERVEHAIHLLSQFDPRPGATFDSVAPTYVVPEIEVRKVDGRWQAFLEERDLPHLRISHRYLELLQTEGISDETRDYVQGKIRAGMNLIKSIEQRQETIQKVAQKIVDAQQAFFEKGRMALRPMVMATIAAEVGVHETTISRTVSNKYMRSPQGIHELRYFFTNAISTDNGEDISSERVKLLVQSLVDAEDPAHPLADQDIERKLAAEGINIARRTIAKYRGMLKIPPSHLRRRI